MGDKDAIGLGPTQLPAAGQAMATGDTRLAPGALAGEYQVVAHIGAGAMGDVYEGKHPVVGKRVAIKVIKHKLAASDEAHKRFIREARAVNQIDHPSVADVFSFGTLDDGRLFLVMDLLEGTSLGDRLRRDGPMAVDEFLSVLEQICDGLDAAHKKGVIHRDLKPDNVFLAETPDGPARVYVLDFGIAKLLTDATSDTASGTLTGEGVWMGTPAYMAPEQWSSDGATARTDVYALGAMAYQMLSGEVPYPAKSVPQMMEKHFHAEIPSLTTTRGNLLPGTLDDVFRRARAKKPDARFDSAGAFFRAAREAVVGSSEPQGRRAVARTMPRTDATGVARSQRPMIVAALGGGAVVAAAVVMLVAMRGDDEGMSSGAASPAGGATGGGARVDVSSDPKGARVNHMGQDIGITPTFIDAKAGDAVRVFLSKPGYAGVIREVTAQQGGSAIRATLPAVTGFEGTWRLPSGKLRAFKRHNDRVAGYQLSTETAEPAFLSFFEFQPSEEGTVRFGAAKEHVDERAPNEPTCRMSLRAEYRYRPQGNTLQIRRETAKYAFKRGRCSMHQRDWTSFEAASRIGAAADLSVAVSRAGGGVVAVPVDNTMRNAGPPPPAQVMDNAGVPLPANTNDTKANADGLADVQAKAKVKSAIPANKPANKPAKKPVAASKRAPASNKRVGGDKSQGLLDNKRQRKQLQQDQQKTETAARKGPAAPANNAKNAGDASSAAKPQPAGPVSNSPPKDEQRQQQAPRKKK